MKSTEVQGKVRNARRTAATELRGMTVQTMLGDAHDKAAIAIAD